MLRIEIVQPANPAVAAFVEHAQPLMALVAANTESSQTLAAIRDALLPKLLSGEIRVKAAEKAVEGVA